MASKMTLKSIRNGLVGIKLIPRPEKTKEGLFLPSDGTLGIQFAVARVVLVGPGVLLDSPGPGADGPRGVHGGTDDLKIGDIVLVRTGEKRQVGPNGIGGVEVKSSPALDFGDEKLIILNQTDVLGVVNVEEVPDAEVIEVESPKRLAISK